jgi:hypothetical protein
MFILGEVVLPEKGTVRKFFGKSGIGKTALGLFLNEESCRRFSLPRRSPPWQGRQPDFEGALPFVAYLDGSARERTVCELLRLDLNQLFRERGKSICPECHSGEVAADFPWEKPEGEFALVTAPLKVPLPEELPDLVGLIRALHIKRYVSGAVLVRLPEGDAELMHQLSGLGQIELVCAAIRRSDSDFEERVRSALAVARGLEKGAFVSFVDVSRGEIAEIRRSERYSFNHDLRCSACLSEFAEMPEQRLDGLSRAEILSLSLREAQIYFPFLAELPHLQEVRLDTPTEELCSMAVRDLQLLRLDEERISDSLVYCDGAVSCETIVNRLCSRGNSVVLTYPYSRTPRALRQGRASAHARYRERGRLVFQFIGLDLGGFLSTLPEARRLGLTEQSFRSPLCVNCRGLGSVRTEEELLGVELETCPECLGLKVKPEFQGVEYREKSFPEILSLTLVEARRLFASRPELSGILHRYLEDILADVQLGDAVSLLPGQKFLALQIIRDGNKNLDLDPVEIDPDLGKLL